MASAASTCKGVMAEFSAGPLTKRAKHLSEEGSPPTLTEEKDMNTTSAAKTQPEAEAEHEPKFRPYFIPAAIKDFVDSALYFALLHLINLVEATKADAEVMRDNTLWERLCKDHWKQFWGFDRQLKIAQAERLKDLRSKEFWYNKYHETEADATRDKITIEELRSLTFSCRRWFCPMPSILPKNWKFQRGIMPTGLLYSETDSLRFDEGPAEHDAQSSVIGSGMITGHPSESMSWYLQDNGGVVNIFVPRTVVSKYNTFHVRRLPNRGWELSSDHQVIRALDCPASLQAIEELWKDYTEDIQLQEIPEELRHHVGVLFPFVKREIPNDERLKNGLTWIRTGLEEDND